jgi:hypothetical protein
MFKHLFLVATTLIAAATTSSATSANDYDLSAIGGYDLVSYHQETGPVRGSGYHVVQDEGVTYLFANTENMATFEANPENYLPAYNGFCAYGVAVGKKFNTDPTVYEIIDGTLYLNLDSGIQNEWSKDITGNIAKADENWKSMH